MTRALILLAVLLVALSDAPTAESGPRKLQRIEVRGYLRHEGALPEVIADFNAAMPTKGGRIRYRRSDFRFCPDIHLPKVRERKRGERLFVVVCHDVPQSAAPFAYTITDARVRRVVVRDLGVPTERSVLCHELMHALTKIGDAKDDNGVYLWPERETSCVWGLLDQPGSFDRELLHKKYGGKDRKHKKRR